MTKEELIKHRIEIYQEGIKKAELEKDISSQMYLRGALEELKWLKKEYADQHQEPKQREVSEAVEFVDWINNNEINGQYYRHQRLNIWNGDYNPDERHYSPLTTQQLYDLFKSKTK